MKCDFSPPFIVLKKKKKEIICSWPEHTKMLHKNLAFLEDDYWPHIGDVISVFPLSPNI